MIQPWAPNDQRLKAARERGSEGAAATHQRPERLLFLILILSCLPAGVGAPALANSFQPDHARMEKGTIEVGIAAGYAQATTAIGDSPSANRSALLVLPRIGIVLTDPLGEGWYRGNVELLLEPVVRPIHTALRRRGSRRIGGSEIQLSFIRTLDTLLGCRCRNDLDRFGSADSGTEHTI